jgi:hypothetical protein
MSVCELRFALKTRSPSAVISKLDKSVIISPSTVFTPAPFYANDTNDVNIISRAITLRGKLQAKQDLALKQGNDYYDYITGEVKSNANAARIGNHHSCILAKHF